MESFKNLIATKGTKIFSHVNRLDIILAAIGSFAAISTISFLALTYNSAILIASFGASSVILYATPTSLLARPQNLIGGHLIAATVGVIMYSLFGMTWWSLAIAVSMAIVLMMVTNTIHPPAGATALIAILTKATPMFIIMPVLTGVIILFIWSLAMNAIHNKLRNHRNK